MHPLACASHLLTRSTTSTVCGISSRRQLWTLDSATGLRLPQPLASIGALSFVFAIGAGLLSSSVKLPAARRPARDRWTTMSITNCYTRPRKHCEQEATYACGYTRGTAETFSTITLFTQNHMNKLTIGLPIWKGLLPPSVRALRTIQLACAYHQVHPTHHNGLPGSQTPYP